MDLLLLQIDGLGFARLQQALEQGRMPRLAQRFRSGSLDLRPTRVDLPSGTLAFQTGLLYGRQDLVPGTRWWDRRAEVQIQATRPRSLRRFEAGLASAQPGLLEGGSAYGSSIGGGASHADLSLAGLARSPSATWRTLRRLPWPLWREVLSATLRPKTFRNALSGLLIRRVFTELCADDLQQGVPAILCNFIGPDELGHRLGPESPEVSAYLEQADQDIERLLDAAERSARPRAVVLYSDHGQNPAVPFAMTYGLSLPDLIAEVIHATAAGNPPFPRPLVLASGNLAQVYFGSTRPLLLDDLQAGWPGWVGVLRRHPGIALLAGRAAGDSIFVGTLGALVTLKPQDAPPAKLGLGAAGAELLERLRELLAQRDCGDVVFFGAEVDGASLSFLDQRGCHNGYLGVQRQAFLATTPNLQLEIPASGLSGSLYRQLSALRWPSAALPESSASLGPLAPVPQSPEPGVPTP